MILRSLHILVALTLLSGTALTTTTAHAQTTAFTIPSNPALRGVTGFTVGYTFTVGASAISVTDLGFWDQDQDGLFLSHPITIWNGSGTSLGTATVPSGTGATLDNAYRYVSLGGSPIALAAGQTYTIGAFFPNPGFPNPSDNSPDSISGGSITAASGIALGAARFNPFNAFPTGDIVGTGQYMAPNFKFTASGGGAAPEPGTLALLALGGVAVLAKRRRK
ncbi:DUF4082 domain-containing protein [Armatimonas sp.]|uniref:DUF4082 domain-containing protein n=1 Tax=Armatimonas sp. TaxID=1872638 RepID=UPI00286B5619|nr:DUF4082 domain-containing protein [Armatimonas sp.]